MTEDERKKLELQNQQNQQNQQNLTNGQDVQQNNLAMQPSNTVTQAQNYLNNQIKPNATPYTQQVYNLYNQLQQRPAGYFDPYSNQGWQYYKNLYTQAGKKAMQDTVAQINQSTGGYGNSYAGAVGQQTYQDYLREMLGAMPEYAQMEYDQMANNAQMGMDAIQNAYALATDQLARGIMPDDYLLQMSGLTEEQARKMMKGSGGNGGGKTKGIVDYMTDGVLGAIEKQNGNITDSETDSVTDSVTEGNISLTDRFKDLNYMKLRDQYPDKDREYIDQLYSVLNGTNYEEPKGPFEILKNNFIDDILFKYYKGNG